MFHGKMYENQRNTKRRDKVKSNTEGTIAILSDRTNALLFKPGISQSISECR